MSLMRALAVLRACGPATRRGDRAAGNFGCSARGVLAAAAADRCGREHTGLLEDMRRWAVRGATLVRAAAGAELISGTLLRDGVA